MPPARDTRAARLEARLSVYAQYAAVVAEQAAATLGGDAGRVATLAEERERVAEHFGELCASAPLAGAASFREALDDALAELAHQGAVDAALGQRLAALREAVVRGAGWGAADAAAPGTAAPGTAAPGTAAPGTPAPRALPAPAPAAGGDAEDVDLELAGVAPAAADPILGLLGGALVAARAAGVGGALAGHYPGRGCRDEYVTEPPAFGGAAPVDQSALPRVDVRF